MFVFLRRMLLSALVAGGMLALAPSTSTAQTADNAIYLELGGNGLLYTLNYERTFAPEWSGRAGLFWFTVDATGEQNTSASATLNLIPLTANYFVGESHRLELGGGPLLLRASASAEGPGLTVSESGFGLGGTATVGYRYQQLDGGFLFRIGLTPIFTSNGFTPWAGLSLGYAF